MKIRHYSGIQNPSAAVALDNQHIIIADDEDNCLRIYPRKKPRQCLQTIDLSDVFKGEVTHGNAMELDLEGAAAIDGTLFWIGSHSTNNKGVNRPARQRLFALSLKSVWGILRAEPLGVNSKLLDALAQDKRFIAYQLPHARTLPSKGLGGLNIEGLAATPAKSLLIGFRNPLIGGSLENGQLINAKALLVELLNPFAVIAGDAPQFGAPIELDLDGLSIRDISWRKKHQYLIVAGPYHDNIGSKTQPRLKTQLFTWSATSGKVKRLKKFDLQDLNIEAAIFYPGKPDKVQLLSDDGQREDLSGFRSVTIKL